MVERRIEFFVLQERAGVEEGCFGRAFNLLV